MPLCRAEFLLNRRTRTRKRNPLLLNAQPARGEEQAVGALFFGGEVGEGGRAVAGVGDGEVLECGDGGGVHEQRLGVGEVGAHGVEDGKAGSIEVAPVSDVGVVEPVQCVKLVGGGAGAEEGDGGRGGVGKRGQGQEGLFVLHDEDAGRAVREEVGCLGEGDFDIAERRGVVEIAQAQAGIAAAQAQVRDAKRREERKEQAAVRTNPLAVHALHRDGALPFAGVGVGAQPGQAWCEAAQIVGA